MTAFFGELYLRSTRPFLPEDVTQAEGEYLRTLFAPWAARGPLLDLGCGHGRHLAQLARLLPGKAVGVDFDLLSLGEAKAHAPVARGDFFQLPFRDRAFAGAWCWYNSAFTFEDHQQLPLFREVARVLRPGALLLLHTSPRERFAALGDARWEGDLPDGSHLLETCRFDAARGRDEGHRTLTLPDGRVMAAPYFIRYYFRDELQQLLETAGFRTVFWHAGISGAPYSKDSPDLLVGAERG